MMSKKKKRGSFFFLFFLNGQETGSSENVRGQRNALYLSKVWRVIGGSYFVRSLGRQYYFKNGYLENVNVFLTF